MQSLFAAVLLFFAGLFQSHHPVTIKSAPAPSHVQTASATAAEFDATVASLQPQAATATSTPPPQPIAAIQVSTPSPTQSNQVLPAPISVLTAALPATNYVTQDELAAQLQIAENSLRSLIYSNTSGGAGSQVGEGQYASGGFTNEIAATNRIDQLSGTTLNNVTVNGISGITAANLPSIDLTSKVIGILPIASGGLGTSTPPSQSQLLLSDQNGNWEYVATSFAVL